VTVNAGAPDYSIVETLTRLNIGARLLYHIRNDDVKDFYIGVRAGFSIWTDQSNPQGSLTEGNVTVPSIQALIGMRKRITNCIGVFIEGGIGTPYFGDAGIYYNVNTKK
jgi:hypothetical protein